MGIHFVIKLFLFLHNIIILFLIPSLSLCGLPFFSGYFSKELIISLSSLNVIYYGNIIYFILIITAGITVFYSIKLLFFLYFTQPIKLNIFNNLNNLNTRQVVFYKHENCIRDYFIENIKIHIKLINLSILSIINCACSLTRFVS